MSMEKKYHFLVCFTTESEINDPKWTFKYPEISNLFTDNSHFPGKMNVEFPRSIHSNMGEQQKWNS